MPKEHVADDMHAVALCEVDEGIRRLEVIDAGLGVIGSPLEGVGRCDGVEVSGREFEGGLLGFRKELVVKGGADEKAVLEGELQRGGLFARAV